MAIWTEYKMFIQTPYLTQRNDMKCTIAKEERTAASKNERKKYRQTERQIDIQKELTQ